MAKFCEACGMPLTEPKEFGQGWPDNPYCVYCTDDAGKLKTYEEVLIGYANYLMNEKGVTLEEGKKTAAEAMALLPAWKNRPKE
jgi:hypothetical protein